MNADAKSPVGQRIREARKRAGIPQDRLGIAIGIDEHSASARISRYESGIHQPQFGIVAALARVLHVPTAYFYCIDDRLAGVVANWGKLTASERAEITSIAESSSRARK